MPNIEHSFNIDIAQEIGVYEAIILKHIFFWVSQNELNGYNLKDGKYWTYQSNKAMRGIFPYFSEWQVRKSISNLKERGIIEVGNYNKSKLDRTQWFSLTEKGFSFFLTQKDKKAFEDSTNLTFENLTNVARDISTSLNTSTDINTESVARTHAREEIAFRPHPTTFNEIISEAEKIGYLISMDEVANFLHHYTSIGWRKGASVIVDWTALLPKWKAGQTKEQHSKAIVEARQRKNGGESVHAPAQINTDPLAAELDAIKRDREARAGKRESMIK